MVAKQIHRQGELSGGRRGVLRDLDRLGPQTVPQMARVRPVSRQHIQTIVNQLAVEGYVEFIENPAHKRSHLVSLTEEGKELVDEMNRLELDLLTGLELGIPEEDMRTAASVLRALREFFDSNRWRRRLRKDER
jgi:Transcriptional regulators